MTKKWRAEGPAHHELQEITLLLRIPFPVRSNRLGVCWTYHTNNTPTNTTTPTAITTNA